MYICHAQQTKSFLIISTAWSDFSTLTAEAINSVCMNGMHVHARNIIKKMFSRDSFADKIRLIIKTDILSSLRFV